MLRNHVPSLKTAICLICIDPLFVRGEFERNVPSQSVSRKHGIHGVPHGFYVHRVDVKDCMSRHDPCMSYAMLAARLVQDASTVHRRPAGKARVVCIVTYY